MHSDLLAEDRLGLPAEALLLRVVPALALRDQRRLAGLVLRHLRRVVGGSWGVLERSRSFFWYFRAVR